MIQRLKKIGSRGDTIVEVLIVLAVLGSAMSLAYATANRGLQKSRNAQEHSQALGIINSQIELLRSAFAKQVGPAIEAQATAGPFCLSTPVPPAEVNITPLANSGVNGFSESLAADKLNNTVTYPGPCIQDSLYNISIVGRGGGVFDFRVRWDGIGNLGRQQEELTYKIGNVGITGAGGYAEPETPPAPAPPPPPPPAPAGFTWTANGRNYFSCQSDPSDPVIGDGHDGCNPPADPSPGSTPVFARRAVDISYRFGTNGTLTGGAITTGQATVAVNFNQYSSAGTTPPAGYTFKLNVKINGILVGTMFLNPNPNPSAAKSQSISVNVPVSNPTSISFDWVNNIGNDPDLQINTVSLSRPGG